MSNQQKQLLAPADRVVTLELSVDSDYKSVSVYSVSHCSQCSVINCATLSSCRPFNDVLSLHS